MKSRVGNAMSLERDNNEIEDWVDINFLIEEISSTFISISDINSVFYFVGKNFCF